MPNTVILENVNGTPLPRQKGGSETVMDTIMGMLSTIKTYCWEYVCLDSASCLS